MPDTTPTVKYKFDIEPKALLKVACAIGVVALGYKLATLFLVFLLGLMLAVTFEPIVAKLEKFRVKRWLGISLIAFSLVGVIVLACSYIIPSIFNQLTSVVKSMPEIKNDLLSLVPENGRLRQNAVQAFENLKVTDPTRLAGSTFSFLHLSFSALGEALLILIFSIYLLIDGRRAFKWFSDFFSAPVRLKLRTTAKETAPIVHRYVMGQVITSVGSALYTYAALSLLHVPAALTLACLAGLLDVLPVVGFIIAVIPAILLALSVNSSTALLVIGVYVLYHAIENYLIIPYVYGSSLQVSSLLVLVTLLVAGTVGGVLCAIAALPIVASYPIIERIWLVKYLGRDVVVKHAQTTGEAVLPEQVQVWNTDEMSRVPRYGGLSWKESTQLMSRKVLVVEDDPDIRTTLQDILDTEGYTTLVASNGKEGIEVLRRNLDVGLILLDISMPVMSGTSFMNVLKLNPKFGHIPVVYLSGSTEVASTDGSAGVLRKPAKIDDVLNTVDKFYRLDS